MWQLVRQHSMSTNSEYVFFSWIIHWDTMRCTKKGMFSLASSCQKVWFMVSAGQLGSVYRQLWKVLSGTGYFHDLDIYFKTEWTAPHSSLSVCGLQGIPA